MSSYPTAHEWLELGISDPPSERSSARRSRADARASTRQWIELPDEADERPVELHSLLEGGHRLFRGSAVRRLRERGLDTRECGIQVGGRVRRLASSRAGQRFELLPPLAAGPAGGAGEPGAREPGPRALIRERQQQEEDPLRAAARALEGLDFARLDLELRFLEQSLRIGEIVLDLAAHLVQ